MTSWGNSFGKCAYTTSSELPTTVTVINDNTNVNIEDEIIEVNVTVSGTPSIMVWSDTGSGIGPTWLSPYPTDVARVLHVLENAIAEEHLSPEMRIEWRYNRNQLIQLDTNYSQLFIDLGSERTRIDRLSETSDLLVDQVALLDEAVNIELAALYQANIDHNQTLLDHSETLLSQTSRILQTESEILLHGGQITALNGGITEVNSKIDVVADGINLTVTENAIDADNRLSWAEAAIAVHTNDISLSVTREADTYQRHLENKARIALTESSITSHTGQIAVLQDDLIETNSNVSQTADAIISYVTRLDTAENSLNEATVTISAFGTAMTASTTALNDATQVVAASQILLSDKWSVSIKEGVDGARYATGFGLNLTPDWKVNTAYEIGDRVFYDERVWDCQADHMSLYELNPVAAHPSYWVEDVNGMKSEFSIQADSFFLYSPLGNHVSPFSMVGDEIQINANVTFASPSTIRTQLNVADGADVTADTQFAIDVLNTLDNIQDQLDGVVESWFYDYTPTTSNAPYTSWVSPDTRDAHLGDLFYNTVNGYSYRFQYVAPNYQWLLLNDSGVTEALAAAAAAQDTADHKRRVFVTTPYVPYDIGDLWDNNGLLMRCITPKILGQSYASGDWQLAATIGAPAGTLVNGVNVSSITAAVSNFNTSNDRRATAVVAPVVISDGTAVDHTLQTDGSADISFEWSWAGDEGDIDGFIIYVRSSSSASTYTFGSIPSGETVYAVPANKRAFILFGSPANSYYTFGVQAYRSVDKDINATGKVVSTLVKATYAGENPYQPSSIVAFAGDITGTVAGTAVTTLISNAANGATAYSGTQLYRSSGVPTNNPVPSGIVTTPNTNGTGNITLYWEPYEQGALPADFFVLFWSKTAAPPTISDNSLIFNINTVTPSKYSFEGVNLADTWSFGLAAARKTENGLEIGEIVDSRLLSVDIGGVFPTDYVLSGATKTATGTYTPDGREYYTITDSSASSSYIRSAETAAVPDERFYTSVYIKKNVNNNYNSAVYIYGRNASRVAVSSARVRVNQSIGFVSTWVSNATIVSYSVVDLGDEFFVSLDVILQHADVASVMSAVYPNYGVAADVGSVDAAFITLCRVTGTPLFNWLGIIGDTPDYTANVGGVAASTLVSNAATALSTANTASTNASSALATLTDIASDSLLTPVEKPSVIAQRDVIVAEQAGIDTQATAYTITTEKTAYDNAVTALTAYLATLTTPVAWDNLTGNTTIEGSTFRSKFNDVYINRQTLLDKIAQVAKSLADAAQTTANNAQTAAANAQTTANTAATNASSALTALTDIASDSLLTPGEKPAVIAQRDVIIAEQSGIDTQATAYGITTEKTAYDTAVTALTTYLATLTSPVLWSNLTGNTTIVGTTFRTKFNDVYTTRQTLLTKIANVAGTLATWSSISGTGKPADNATVGADWATNVTNIPYSTIVNNDDAVALGFNPTFSDWTGTYPVGYSAVLGAGCTISKETSIKQTGNYSIKFVCAGGVNNYLSSPLASFGGNPLPVGTFVSGSFNIYLESVVAGLPAILVRLFTNAALTTYESNIYAQPAGSVSGWQRVPFTVRSTGANRIYGIRVYLMASYSTNPGGYFQGTCYFDSFNLALFDSTVDNKSITINSNGTLSGGGSGAVTITGLGYTGALNADKTSTVDLAAQINANTTTIAGGKITTGSITATQIASRTITADRIAAGAITANEIAANTITASKIAANTIETVNIKTGNITTETINNGAVTEISAYVSDGATIPTTTWTQIAICAVNSVGNNVLIELDIKSIPYHSNHGCYARIYLYRNGIEIGYWCNPAGSSYPVIIGYEGEYQITVWIDTWFPFCKKIIDNPGTGVFTYTVAIWTDNHYQPAPIGRYSLLVSSVKR